MTGMIDIAFRICRLGIVVSIPCLLAATAAAQPPAATPTTAVLVNLTMKPDVDRAQVASTLPKEVRATVDFVWTAGFSSGFRGQIDTGLSYIRQRSGCGAAKTLMEQLPLAKAGLVNWSTESGPLSPLRTLLSTPGAPKKHDDEMRLVAIGL